MLIKELIVVKWHKTIFTYHWQGEQLTRRRLGSDVLWEFLLKNVLNMRINDYVMLLLSFLPYTVREMFWYLFN